MEVFEVVYGLVTQIGKEISVMLLQLEWGNGVLRGVKHSPKDLLRNFDLPLVKNSKNKLEPQLN